ncbi:MAG: tRNA (N6-isopentenyl adenosine(37)-C2)-methylthiotransferase MiaB [Candidatus Omnitrophota bacterium]
MNARDSEVIAGNLVSKGYKLVDSADKADVVLLNTCSVRQHAEDRVWSEIGKYKKRNTRDAIHNTKPIIGLVGCMAEYHKYDAFKKAPQLDFVCGPNNIAAIPFLIEQARNGASKGMAVGQRQRDEFAYNTNFQGKTNESFVVISEGCNNFCSYCVVPYVRGIEHSRHYEDILREIKDSIEKGVRDIILLGQNVNSYISCQSSAVGCQIEKKVNFIDLLKMVNDVKGLKSFSFITSHPKDASRELFEAMAKLEKLKKILHLPLQSGSDRILKLMNRGYTKKEYLDKVKQYKDIVGGILSSDIIVGFPTETENDFLETKKVMQDLKFDNAYIFKYSLRPHTGAAKLTDDVPLKEKQRRHKILLDIQKKISREKR